jgi:pilus assembly protein Flp/PilA
MLQTMNQKSLELAVISQVAVTNLIRRTRERLEAEDGQTAAEYIGIILVIVAIITAVSVSSIGTTIGSKIDHAINSVSSPKGK